MYSEREERQDRSERTRIGGEEAICGCNSLRVARCVNGQLVRERVWPQSELCVCVYSMSVSIRRSTNTPRIELPGNLSGNVIIIYYVCIRYACSECTRMQGIGMACVNEWNARATEEWVSKPSRLEANYR